jgi:hypothetical protein
MDVFVGCEAQHRQGAGGQACLGANNQQQTAHSIHRSRLAGRQEQSQAVVRACCSDALYALCRSGGDKVGVAPAGKQSTAGDT